MTPLNPSFAGTASNYVPGVAAAVMAVAAHVGLWFVIDLMVEDASAAHLVLAIATIPLAVALLGTSPVAIVIWSGCGAVAALFASSDLADDRKLRFFTVVGLLLVAGTTAVELASNLRRKPEVGQGVVAIRMTSVVVAALVGVGIALGLVELALSRVWDTWFIPGALGVTGVCLLLYARQLVKRAKRELPPPPVMPPPPRPRTPPPPPSPTPPPPRSSSTGPPLP